ncbi:MAG: disulfide bond formation protein DsbA [Sneathiella sp.]|nr:MAG: disulfide bond formation protein DsbA [Sneathiella sp.]
MTVQVEFHFDFGSPNTYFCHKLLPDIAKRADAEFVYVPILLGGVFKLTNNQPPMIQFANVLHKQDYMRKEIARFIEDHGLIKFQMNPNFPVNTVALMRGAIVAEDEGFLDKYVDAVYSHMWEDGLKMDDPDVFVSALNGAGMDGAHILERTQEQGIKDILIQNTSASVERGNFGAPTFFVGDEMFFGKDRLDAVEREIAKQN